MRFRSSVVSMLVALASLIGIGTVAYHYIEGWTIATSFYFSVATLTTVGYGDIHPSTDASRVFTAFFILVGVGIVFSALSSIGSKYLITQEKELNEKLAHRLHTSRGDQKDKH